MGALLPSSVHCVFGCCYQGCWWQERTKCHISDVFLLTTLTFLFVPLLQVKRQRYQYKLKNEKKPSTMTDERIVALEQVGFVWDSHGAAWLERWGELAEFQKEYGHANVPSNHPKNPQLATWVKVRGACMNAVVSCWSFGFGKEQRTHILFCFESVNADNTNSSGEARRVTWASNELPSSNKLALNGNFVPATRKRLWQVCNASRLPHQRRLSELLGTSKKNDPIGILQDRYWVLNDFGFRVKN